MTTIPESRCELCGGWFMNVTAHKRLAHSAGAMEGVHDSEELGFQDIDDERLLDAVDGDAAVKVCRFENVAMNGEILDRYEIRCPQGGQL